VAAAAAAAAVAVAQLQRIGEEHIVCSSVVVVVNAVLAAD
jgi:hypothetical protein